MPTLPDVSALLSNVGIYSKPVFGELLPIGLFIAGLSVAALILLAIIRGIAYAFSMLTHRGKYDA